MSGEIVLAALLAVAAASQPASHEVKVTLDKTDRSSCAVTFPVKYNDAGYFIHAAAEDTVTWKITNNCRRTVQVGVGGFKPSSHYTGNAATLPPSPLKEDESTLTTSVTPGGTGKLTAHMKAGLTSGDMWHYDIVDAEQKGTPLGDPEIEVP